MKRINVETNKKRISFPSAVKAAALLCAACVASCTALGFAGCSRSSLIENGYQPYNEIVVEETTVSPADVDTEIKPRDADDSYDSSTSKTVTFSDSGVTITGEGISVADGTITIKAAGTYIISGEIKDGGIVVKASKEDDVKLVLSGVTVEKSGFAALYVVSADNVIVTLAEGTVNRLSSSGDFSQIDDNNVNACVYSKDDIAFNGSGSLVINCDSGHGIAAKDDMVISGTEMQITAGGHGINVNDSLKIDGAVLTVRSGKDAIHCENEEDASLGNVYISKGEFSFVAGGDGIDASGIIRIDDGNFDIESGEYRDPEQSADFGSFGFGRSGGFGGSGRGASSGQAETETASTKGVKADTEIDIMGGSFRLVCEDDAIHSDGKILIGGGSFEISSGDDGIHADAEITIYTPEGCDIRIDNSYEGIEAAVIVVNAGPGSIFVNASDDGFNASDGQGEGGFGSFGGFGGRGQSGSGQTSSTIALRFLSGTVTVDSYGDGIDSNGTLEVKGGLICISGPTSNNNGALDYGSKGVITGGTVIACGSSGMAQNFGSESTQGSILVNCGTLDGGTEVTLLSGDSVIASFTPSKQFGSIVVSSPELKKGGTYTITAGQFSTEITLSSLIYSAGGGIGGMDPGGMNPGGMNPGGSQGGFPGGRPGGDQGGFPGGRPGGDTGDSQGGEDAGNDTKPGGNGDDPEGMGSGDVAPGDFGPLKPGNS